MGFDVRPRTPIRFEKDVFSRYQECSLAGLGVDSSRKESIGGLDDGVTPIHLPNVFYEVPRAVKRKRANEKHQDGGNDRKKAALRQTRKTGGQA
jgi:hypothetical protein